MAEVATVVTYGYDAVGRARDVRSGANTLATFSYYDDDLLKDATLGNGVLESFSYNGRGWPTSILATAAPTTYLDLAYSSYDYSGNILAIGGTTQAPQTFTYDRLDRLKTASGGYGTHFYDYDAIGNRKRLDLVFLRPMTGGPPPQWSKNGGGGSNWDRVAEATQNGDSTYVYTSTVGNRDLYALQDNTQTGAINAVTVTAVARAEWSSSCDPNCYGALKLRIGGSATAESPVRSVATAYESVSYTWTTKPGGAGGAWTDADLDNLQAGIELASGGTASTVRVTQVFVTVNVGNSVVYTYADGPTGMDTLSSLTKNGATTSFTYTVNGNLDTKTGGWTYQWNYENLMTTALVSGAQQQTYKYDGLGRRVKMEGTSGSTWTVSVYSGMDPIFEKDQSGVVTKYVYANGMRIAKITSGPEYKWYLADHLGSTRKVLDSSRNTVFSAEYEPFGKLYVVSGNEAFKFTGEKHDDPTGLVYLRARQYDADIGRFLSADPALGSLSGPQTLNRYSYVANNPLKFTDPTGEVINLIAAGIGAAIGAIVGYVGCGIVTGGWTSAQCGAAALAGAAVGALAGLTFGASLYIAGSAGLGTAVSGGSAAFGAGVAGSGFVFSGLSGFAAVTFAGAVSGAVAGGAGYLLDSRVYGYDVTAQGFVNAVGMGAVSGAFLSAAGYTAGELASWVRPMRLGGSTPQGGEPMSWWRYRGQNVRINSGHGQAAEHGFAGTGLRVNQVETAITTDVVQGIKAGRFTINQVYKPAGYVGVGGYTVGYDGRYLPTFFSVSTYYLV